MRLTAPPTRITTVQTIVSDIEAALQLYLLSLKSISEAESLPKHYMS